MGICESFDLALYFTGQWSSIDRGVKQGDPVSPTLFTCVFENVFKNMNWEYAGLSVNGESLTNL